MKTFKEFVQDLHERDFGTVMKAALTGSVMGGLPKRVTDTIKSTMRIPVTAPKVRAPYTPPPLTPSAPFKPGKSALGAAALSAITTKTADVLTKAANPQSWQQASKEIKARQSQPTPFQQFLQTKKTNTETGVGVKPRVAAPYTPPRPAAIEKPKPKAEPVVQSEVEPVRKKIVPPVAKPKAKPVDPELQRYQELRKSDPTAAKEFGMKIWSRKYRPGLTPPEIA